MNPAGNVDDTIAAIASAPGGALRGIVRLSGLQTVDCLARCCRSVAGQCLSEIRSPSAVPVEVQLPPPLRSVDAVLYLWPSNRSYTRQPAAELHTIGSPPVLDAVMQALMSAGARLASPGEFTLRAFLAGRIDLTQAEAVLGVIDAHSERELDVALAQLAGGLAKPLSDLRDRLLELLAQLEAGLDFADEDIEFVTQQEVIASLGEISDRVRQLRQRIALRGETIDAFRVVLAGWPNVGKSSLWNALTGQGRAIVARQAGTTRDYLSCRVSIDGLPCLVIDTAGTDEDVEAGVEAIAQRMSRQQTSQAHVKLLCLDATRPLNSSERSLVDTRNSQQLLVLTKCDQMRRTDLHHPAIETSSKTGKGLPELRKAIAARILEQLAGLETEAVAGTAIRCREGLRLAAESLQQATGAAVDGLGEELVAAELRVALEKLGELAGVVYTEDILDRVFSRFCIGK